MLPNFSRRLLFVALAGVLLGMSLMSAVAQADAPTAAVLVKDINVGADSSATASSDGGGFGGQVALNGIAYFFANDGVHGAELWRSDGTAAGTFLVKDINPGPASGQPDAQSYLTVIDGSLYFRADDGTHGHELWKSDGIDAGTVQITTGVHVAELTLTAAGATLYFATDEGLWKSKLLQLR